MESVQLDFSRALTHELLGHCLLALVSLEQTAMFDLLGLWGLAYWYSVWPLHQIVFAGMLLGLAQAGGESGREVRTRKSQTELWPPAGSRSITMRLPAGSLLCILRFRTPPQPGRRPRGWLRKLTQPIPLNCLPTRRARRTLSAAG